MSLNFPDIDTNALSGAPALLRRALITPARQAFDAIKAFAAKLLRAGDNFSVITLGTASAPVMSGTAFVFAPAFRPYAFTLSHATNTDGVPIAITGWQPDLRGDGNSASLTVTLSGASTGIVTGVLWGIR